MDTSTLTHYLHLFHCEAIHTVLFSRLLKEFGNIASVLESAEQPLLTLGLNREQVTAIQQLDKNPAVREPVDIEMKWQQTSGNAIICYESNDYPHLLREIDCAPPLLFVVGRKALLSSAQIAIVGSRNASSYGTQNAFWMAHELSQAGLVIDSGLAKGVDTHAHLGALAANKPTLAVLGSGADIVYPAGNKQLAAQIAEEGAVISEFPLGMPPLPQNFPRRNRILSGLCLGILVVEAAPKSGSLITARLAMEQNRDVFAIPGSISGQLSRGCHRLIKEGAKLVEQPSDILEELGGLSGFITATSSPVEVEASVASERAPGINRQNKLILEVMGYQGCLLQTMLDHTGMEIQQLNMQLLQLELQGQIEVQGGRYTRVK